MRSSSSLRPNLFNWTMVAWRRYASGTRFRASSLLSTSTTIHALCTPSWQPKSACVKKCEPLSRSTLAAREQATTSDSCGTSMRNLAMCCSLPRGGSEFKMGLAAEDVHWNGAILSLGIPDGDNVDRFEFRPLDATHATAVSS